MILIRIINTNGVESMIVAIIKEEVNMKKEININIQTLYQENLLLMKQTLINLTIFSLNPI